MTLLGFEYTIATKGNVELMRIVLGKRTGVACSSSAIWPLGFTSDRQNGESRSAPSASAVAGTVHLEFLCSPICLRPDSVRDSEEVYSPSVVNSLPAPAL